MAPTIPTGSVVVVDYREHYRGNLRGGKWLDLSDGALHAGDESDQPDEERRWAEARATSGQVAETGMKAKMDEQTSPRGLR